MPGSGACAKARRASSQELSAPSERSLRCQSRRAGKTGQRRRGRSGGKIGQALTGSSEAKLGQALTGLRQGEVAKANGPRSFPTRALPPGNPGSTRAKEGPRETEFACQKR